MGLTSWWGRYSLSEGGVRTWRVGRCDLAIARFASEWQVAWQEQAVEAADQAPSGDGVDWQSDEAADMPQHGNLERYALARTGPGLWLRPRLADRPVVTLPRIPLHLLAGEAVTLFVGSPVWVEIGLDEPERSLCEIPVRRPSDTWFGTSREGELCYVTRTSAALDRTFVPHMSRRAVTAVRVHNDSSEPLELQRLKLPVPLLALYDGGDGSLWTQSVKMTRERDSEFARFEVESGPPSDAAKELSPAREEQKEESPLIRAFSGVADLFS